MQDPRKPTIQRRSLVRAYLGPELPSLALATLTAVGLGLVAAAVQTLYGPAVQIITSPRASYLPFVDLFGERLAPVAQALFRVDGMTAGDLLSRVPFWLIAVAAAKAALGLTQWYLMERSGERASLRLRRDLVARFLAVDPARRKDPAARAKEAELSTAVTNDVRSLREFIVHYYGGLPREGFVCAFSVVALILLSTKLTLIFLLGVLPAGAVLSRIGKKVRKRAGKALADYSTLAEWIQQRLLGVETIKHYGTERLESEKMAVRAESLFQRFLQAARVKARTSPMLEAFGVAAFAVVLLVAFRDVAAGKTTGSVQFSYFAMLATLSQSASKLGRYLNSNREGAAAADRLGSMLDFLEGAAKEAPAHLESQTEASVSLTLDNVSVRYPGVEQDALSGFRFRFEGGRIYCLVGPSGAGKTTVFGVALGLVEPRAGRVFAASPDNKQKMIYMPQKVQLAPASVAANVAYPEAVPERARVAAALARVGLAGLADSLPEGLDTRVGEGGHGVSGGQAQRVLLARLCYHEAPFAFVDEGTSALDPEVERLVYDVLKDMAARGAAVVTIAHRPSAAAIADEILLLEGGKLVAHGAPDAVRGSVLFQRLMS